MNSSKKSYIDYYNSEEITEISEKCKRTLLELINYLRCIDASDFDDWDKSELQSDKNRVTRMIEELVLMSLRFKVR